MNKTNFTIAIIGAISAVLTAKFIAPLINKIIQE